MDAIKAQEISKGLHDLADFINDQYESLPEPESDALHMKSWIWSEWNGPEHEVQTGMAAVIRAGLNNKAKITKEYGEGRYGAFKLHLGFGPVTYSVLCRRTEVCTAEVVGQKVVEIEEPIGEDLRPTTTVTTTKDIIEWRCDPILERLTD